MLLYFLASSVLVYKDAFDICVLTLHPATLLNLFIKHRNILLEFCRYICVSGHVHYGNRLNIRYICLCDNYFVNPYIFQNQMWKREKGLSAHWSLRRSSESSKAWSSQYCPMQMQIRRPKGLQWKPRDYS